MKSFDNMCGIYMDLPRELLTSGAVLSFLSIGVIFILFYYYKIPNLRRHPTTIAIHKCWFELIFVSQFLWIAFAPHDFFWDTYSSDDSRSCVTNENIWPLAWLVQFSLLGGELWFAVMSIDIHQSLTNPFTSYTINYQYYTTGVYSIAILVATIFVSIIPIQYGLSVDPMIWVNVYNNPSNGRWTKFAIFYIFMVIIYMYCGVTAIWARNQIYKGLEETLAVRKYSISKQTRYVIGYFTFWTCVFVLQFINYLNDAYNSHMSLSNNQDDHVRSASAFLLASRGVWSLGIFLVANWAEISAYFRSQREGKSVGALGGGRAPPPKVEQEQVQLNVALQTEIVRFTVLGIQRAIRDVEETMAEQERLSGAGAGASSFFNRRTEAFSFLITDPGHSCGSSCSERPTGAGLAPSVDSMRDESAVDPETGLGRTYCNSPLRSLQHDAAAHLPGGNVLGSTGSKATADLKDLSFRSSTFRKSDAVNFTLQDDDMIRQDSASSDTVRSSLNMSNNFMHHIGHRIRQRFVSNHRRSSFLFTDYCPKQFSQMRELSGITNDEYLNSFKSTTMPSFSEGRSGAFLYFSSDRKYIVKTTTKMEFEKLLQILPEYVNYYIEEISQGHKPLITKYFGAHKIVMYDIPLYFVIMQNICPSVSEKYDLKGSWVNRHSSKRKDYNPKDIRPKKFNIGMNMHNTSSHYATRRRQDGAQLFLDNDLQNCFLLDPRISKLLAEQILRDIKLLARFNLMDYSLLVGIKRRNFEVIDTATSAGASAGNVLTHTALNRTQQQSGSTRSTATTAAADMRKATATSTAAASGACTSSSNSHPHHILVPGTVSRSASDFREPDGAMHAAVVEGQGTFYIGIIDILQEWNYDKWYERMLKVFLLRKDGKGLSAMDPLNYRKRFFQRAVLDVFDGLGLDDADDADIFERHTVLAADMGSERDTVDTVLSGRGKDSRGTIGSGSLGLSFSAGAAGTSSGKLSGDLDGAQRETDLSASESSSFSHEVQLQPLSSGSSLRDSSSLRSSSPLGTDRRFQVKPLTK